MTRNLLIVLSLGFALLCNAVAQECPYEQGNKPEAKKECGDCCAKTQAGACADELVAAWKALPEKLAGLADADKQALETAKAALAKSCPACKNFAPTMAFLKASFAAQAALDAKAMKCPECKDGKACDMCAAMTKEAMEMCGKRTEAVKQALALVTAMCEASIPAGQQKGCCGDSKECEGTKDAAKKEDCSGACSGESCDSAAGFTALGKKGGEMAKNWSEGIPAALNALPADEQKNIHAALGVVFAKHPGASLKVGTFKSLESLAALCVKVDEYFVTNCPSKQDPSFFEKHAAMKPMMEAFMARSQLAVETRNVLQSVNGFMAKVTGKAAGCEKKACGGGECSGKPEQN